MEYREKSKKHKYVTPIPKEARKKGNRLNSQKTGGQGILERSVLETQTFPDLAGKWENVLHSHALWCLPPTDARR